MVPQRKISRWKSCTTCSRPCNVDAKKPWRYSQSSRNTILALFRSIKSCFSTTWGLGSRMSTETTRWNSSEWSKKSSRSSRWSFRTHLSNQMVQLHPNITLKSRFSELGEQGHSRISHQSPRRNHVAVRAMHENHARNWKPAAKSLPASRIHDDYQKPFGSLL